MSSGQEGKLIPHSLHQGTARTWKFSLICAFLASDMLLTQHVTAICPQYRLHLLTVPRLCHQQAFPSRTETGVGGQWLSSLSGGVCAALGVQSILPLLYSHSQAVWDLVWNFQRKDKVKEEGKHEQRRTPG